VLTAKWPSIAPHLGTTPGVADMPSNRRGSEGTTASTERRGQKLQRGQPEQIEPRGQDQLDDARRRWRRTVAKSTNPRSQMEALDEAKLMPHMATVELAGIGQRSHRRFGIAREERGLGLASDRVGEREGAAGWAGLVQSSPLGLT
jgi:hypothetical protein